MKMPYSFIKAENGWLGYDNTISELMTTTMSGCLGASNPDVNASIESHFLNVQLYANKATYDLDIGKDMWLNVGRWSRLIKEYVPADGWKQFKSSARSIYSGDCRDGAATGMMFRDPPRYMKKHRWGGCLMSAVFTHRPGRSPLLTINSRTSYLGYMGMLDAAIGSCMARFISRGESEKVSFAWNLSSLQFHGFKSLPYMFHNESWMNMLTKCSKVFKGGPKCKEVAELRKSTSPTWFILARWYYTILRDFDRYGKDMCARQKYGPLKRVMRRWLEWKRIGKTPIPPSLPVTKLKFEKAE